LRCGTGGESTNRNVHKKVTVDITIYVIGSVTAALNPIKAGREIGRGADEENVFRPQGPVIKGVSDIVFYCGGIGRAANFGQFYYLTLYTRVMLPIGKGFDYRSKGIGGNDKVPCSLLSKNKGTDTQYDGQQKSFHLSLLG
jgi:hypothetical protein